MKYLALYTPLVLVLGLCAAACAPQNEVVKLYEDSAADSGQYGHLLVVSISEDANQRQMFEDEIVAQLRRNKVAASASYSFLSYSQGLSSREISALSEKEGADAFLLVQIASIDAKADVDEGRQEVVSTCRRGDPIDYFLYDHEVLKEPDEVKFAHTVVVISNLHDTATKERVWSIQSTCYKKSSLIEALANEAKVIVNQLRVDGRI